MPITALSQIPGFRFRWNARTSAPTLDPATGTITAAGSDLSGAGSTIALIGSPRYVGGVDTSDPRFGMLCSAGSDLSADTARMGMRVTFPAAPTSYIPRKLLVLAVVTPYSIPGDRLKGAGTIWRATGSGNQPFALFTYTGSGQGAIENAGKCLISGGTGQAFTTQKYGTHRQVVGFYSTSAGPAYGAVNRSASKSAGANTSPSDTINGLTIGYLPASDSNPSVPGSNNPFIGVIHDLAAFAIDSASGTDFSEINEFFPAIDILKSEWDCDCDPTTANLISVCGDSIEQGSGSTHNTVANGASTANTTLTANAAQGAGTLTVASIASIPTGTRVTLDPGTNKAEIVVVASKSGSTLTLASPTRKAHSAGAKITDGGFGYVTPYHNALLISPLFSRLDLFIPAQCGWAGAQAQQATSSTTTGGGGATNDGSMAMLSTGSKRAFFQERGTNDGFNGSRTAINIRDDNRTICTNARNNGANYVIAVQILNRNDSSGGNANNAIFHAYNTYLETDLGTYFDAISRVAEHPWLSDPSNPATITIPGAGASTAINGTIFDAIGVHPRDFGQACRALMHDKAYCQASSTDVPYAPKANGATAARQGMTTKVDITFETPSSPDAPKAPGHTGDAASALKILLRRNGTLIATIAPAAIDVTTGEADWTGRLTYTDTLNPDGSIPYTVEIVDAAGNTSGETPFSCDPFTVTEIDTEEELRTDLFDVPPGTIVWNGTGSNLEAWQNNISDGNVDGNDISTTLQVTYAQASIPDGREVKEIRVDANMKLATDGVTTAVVAITLQSEDGTSYSKPMTITSISENGRNIRGRIDGVTAEEIAIFNAQKMTALFVTQANGLAAFEDYFDGQSFLYASTILRFILDGAFDANPLMVYWSGKKCSLARAAADLGVSDSDRDAALDAWVSSGLATPDGFLTSNGQHMAKQLRDQI